MLKSNTCSLLGLQTPQISQRSGFSSLSAGPDMAQYSRISVGGGRGGGGGGGYYGEDVHMGTYQGNRHQPEVVSLHAMRQQTMPTNAWMVDGSDGASMASDRDAGFSRHYVQSNGYTGQVRQGAGTMTFPGSMRRSHSGTISRGPEMDMGMVQQCSYKGPAYRTINRINNRNRMSMGSMSGTLQRQMSSASSMFGGGVDKMDSGFIGPGMSSASQGNLQQRRQSTMSRAMSVKSMQSVGRGVDIFNGQMGMGSMGNLNG